MTRDEITRDEITFKSDAIALTSEADEITRDAITSLTWAARDEIHLGFDEVSA